MSGAQNAYPNGDPLHIWVGNPDAAKARAWAEAHMAAAQAQVDALLAVKGPRTVENTLRPFDEATRELDLAGSGAGLLTNASPNKELRDVGDEVSQKVVGGGDGAGVESGGVQGAAGGGCDRRRIGDALLPGAHAAAVPVERYR